MASLTRVVRCLAQGRVGVCRRLLSPCQRPNILSCRSESSLLWEPELNTEPEIPEYSTLNIRVRGYDYVILESYQRYVNKLTKILGLESGSYPVPARTTHVQTYKFNSTIPDSEFKLAQYERTIQIEGLSSTMAPILFETLQRHLPQGLTFTIKELDEEEEEFRYVPDHMVLELEAMVKDMEKIQEDRRR